MTCSPLLFENDVEVTPPHESLNPNSATDPLGQKLKSEHNPARDILGLTGKKKGTILLPESYDLAGRAYRYWTCF